MSKKVKKPEKVEKVWSQPREWEEFQKAGMFWFVNMILHTFGWALTYQIEDGKILKCYPARVKFRGFEEGLNTKGYQMVSKYLKDNITELEIEAKDELDPEDTNG